MNDIIQKINNYSIWLKAPLILAIKTQYLIALFWIAIWGSTFYFESYLLMAERKHAYSWSGLTTIVGIGITLEILFSIMFALLATVFTSFLQRIWDQYKNVPPTFDEWWLIFAAASVYPSFLMILLILLFQGNANWLFGGIVAFNGSLLLYYSYLRLHWFGIAICITTIIVSRLLQSIVLSLLSTVFYYFAG